VRWWGVFFALWLWAGAAMADGEWPALLKRERLMGEWLVEGPGRHGFDWSVGYTADVWGNTSGGSRRGAVYTGLMELGAEIDLGEAVGWRGARVGTSWLWLSGQDVSAEDVGNFLTVSNIAGFQTFRMFELWWEQEVGDWALKAGQISVDADFALTEYGAVFLNSAFGWPTFLSGNLPGGGVAYPVGGLG
jgi:porin